MIDPRTLQPLDTATVVESVRKTNRVIVVHEAVRFGGLGAEIAAQIQEQAFDYLDAPVGRDRRARSRPCRSARRSRSTTCPIRTTSQRASARPLPGPLLSVV